MRMTCKKCESTYDGSSPKELYETVGRRCSNPLCEILCDKGAPMPVKNDFRKFLELATKKPTKKERKLAAALLRKQVAAAAASAPKPEINKEESNVEMVYIEFDDAITYHVYP